MSKPKCFIIMPITTRPEFIEQYGGDKDHFQHVLDCLFVPAVEEAGFDPVPPIAEGSDVIHASIIKHLVEADMVLCDMSRWNPNVFFEWGIRTAFNKPVSVVKDDQTEHPPFDVGPINHEVYQSILDPWTIKKAIQELSAHIETCKDNDGTNSMWQRFAINVSPGLPEAASGSDAKLNYLTQSFDTMQRQQAEILKRLPPSQKSGIAPKNYTLEVEPAHCTIAGGRMGANTRPVINRIHDLVDRGHSAEEIIKFVNSSFPVRYSDSWLRNVIQKYEDVESESSSEVSGSSSSTASSLSHSDSVSTSDPE